MAGYSEKPARKTLVFSIILSIIGLALLLIPSKITDLSSDLTYLGVTFTKDSPVFFNTVFGGIFDTILNSLLPMLNIALTDTVLNILQIVNYVCSAVYVLFFVGCFLTLIFSLLALIFRDKPAVRLVNKILNVFERIVFWLIDIIVFLMLAGYAAVVILNKQPAQEYLDFLINNSMVSFILTGVLATMLATQKRKYAKRNTF